MSDIRGDEIKWKQRQKGQFLGTVEGDYCKYFLEESSSGKGWLLYLNYGLNPPCLGKGRISFLMRMAEIHLIRNG